MQLPNAKCMRTDVASGCRCKSNFDCNENDEIRAVFLNDIQSATLVD